jgi:tRNA-dihydrouridine synthase 1
MSMRNDNHAVSSFLQELKRKKRKKDKEQPSQSSQSQPTSRKKRLSTTKATTGTTWHPPPSAAVTAAAEVSSSQRQQQQQQPHHPQLQKHLKPKKRPIESPNSRDHSTVVPTNSHSSAGAIASLSLSMTLRAAAASVDDAPTLALLHPHRYILAPMVGASELPFRLLCRRYGADVCYTPMMDATQFACSASYRAGYHLQSTVHTADRPIVAHVSANTPSQLAAAAVTAAQLGCAQIDLNLGCPQRTAYLGHYGSYLLDEPQLICDMVSAAVQALRSKEENTSGCVIPVSVKIRLLSTVEQTLDFCRQLVHAGVSLIAIHARHRASWERTSAGARDGPALLDQVHHVQQALQSDRTLNRVVAIVTNGNTITYNDVEQNLQLTQADGLMSAEGILDNPALFLPRHGTDRHQNIAVWSLHTVSESERSRHQGKVAKLQQRLSDIAALEEKVSQSVNGATVLTDDEVKLLAAKERKLRKLHKLQDSKCSTQHPNMDLKREKVTLGSLLDEAKDKWKMALMYLDFATAFPVAIRTVVFHIRRMLKDMLIQYQLLQDCLACTDIAQVRAILMQMDRYRTDPSSFVFDSARAKSEAETLKRKKLEEGKRKAYEARMIRKAKREGKSDLHYYLSQGAALPTATQMQAYRQMERDQVLTVWKQHHSQHCLSFHLDANGCPRDRACAFLHVEQSANTFRETDEVAG